jgi:uncharacterized membrane protein YfcA
MGTIIFVIFTILISAFIQGLTSFGFPLLAVPILSFLLPIQLVVPFLSILCISANLFMIKETIHIKEYKKLAISLALPSLITIPIGVACLKYINPGYIKVFLGIFISISAILLAFGLRVTIKREKLWTLTVGLLAGFLNGLATVGGPPLILYFSNLSLEKNVFRGMTIVIFFLLNIVSAITMTINGLMSMEILKYALIGIPLLFIGVYFGTKLSRKVDEKLFKHMTLVLLILIGISTIVSGIKAL